MQDLPPTVVSDECKQRLGNLRCNWSKAWLETWDVMERWKAIVDSLLKQRGDLAPGLALYWDWNRRLWVVLPQGRCPRLFWTREQDGQRPLSVFTKIVLLDRITLIG